jgi:hypothetical protein
MAEDFSTWIAKTEAAKRLNIGIRTLERRIQEQGLRVAYRRIPNRKPLAVLHPDDLATLQAEMIPATPIEEDEPRALAVKNISRPALEVVALLRAAQIAPQLPLFLDLKAASSYSGLPQSYLRELIENGELKAVKRRKVLISRFSLEKLAQ